VQYRPLDEVPRVTSEYGLAEPAQRLPREIDKRDLSSFVRHHGSSSSISRGRSISARATARLTLTIGRQPTYKLRPYQSRTFVIGEFKDLRVEFGLGPDGGVDKLVFHQPNGSFVSRRA
jgi:hypothetical protein